MSARGSRTLALLAIIGWSAIAVAAPPESRRATTASQRRVAVAAYQQSAQVEELPPPENADPGPVESDSQGFDQWLYDEQQTSAPEEYQDASEYLDTCGEGCCDGSWGNDCGPVWYTEAGALFLHRSTAHHQVLTQTPQVFTIASIQIVVQRELQSTRSFDFGYQPGLRATIGRNLGTDLLNRDHSLEFTYFGLQQWKAQHDMIGDRVTSQLPIGGVLQPVIIGRLNSPFPLTVDGFNRADVHHIENSSNLNNFEVNYRIRKRLRSKRLVGWPDGRWTPEDTPGRVSSMLLGLRYISLDDQFKWQSRGEIQEVNTGISTKTAGDYNTRTTNDLLGMQIGADFAYRIGRATFAFRGKTGIYGNVTNVNSELHTAGLASTFELPQSQYQLRGTRLGFVGEMGAVITWDLKPNWSVIGAYDMMWIQGLALAPEQLSFSPGAPPRITDSGYLFFQGFTIGTELRW